MGRQKKKSRMPTDAGWCCALWETFPHNVHQRQHANQFSKRSIQTMWQSEGLHKDYALGQGWKMVPAHFKGQSRKRGKRSPLQELPTPQVQSSLVRTWKH